MDGEPELGHADGTLAWIRRRHARVAVSPDGTQPSFAVVQRTPFCQVAERSRSSFVSSGGPPDGWGTFGGVKVVCIVGSASIHWTFRLAGVPVIATMPNDG